MKDFEKPTIYKNIPTHTTDHTVVNSPKERVVIFKPCPFCGDEPQVETIGTFIEIYCCSSMELQKSDVLTIEERETWDNTKHIYGKQAELKALKNIAEDWNKRI